MAQAHFFGFPVVIDDQVVGSTTASLVTFFGGTATARPSGAAQAAVSTATLLTPFNSGSFTTLIARVDALTVLVNELRRSVVSLNIIAGA